MHECIQFAEMANYQRITLWTAEALVQARRIYLAAGFRLVKTSAGASFVPHASDEIWERKLEQASAT